MPAKEYKKLIATSLTLIETGTPAETQEMLADAMNLAANVIGAYALRWEMETDFVPDMGTAIEQSARNFVVQNR